MKNSLNAYSGVIWPEVEKRKRKLSARRHLLQCNGTRPYVTHTRYKQQHYIYNTMSRMYKNLS